MKPWVALHPDSSGVNTVGAVHAQIRVSNHLGSAVEVKQGVTMPEREDGHDKRKPRRGGGYTGRLG
jgi:hypothetical protein